MSRSCRAHVAFMLRWSRTAPSGRGEIDLSSIVELASVEAVQKIVQGLDQVPGGFVVVHPGQPATRGRVEARSRFPGRPVQGQCGQRGRALEGLTVARSRARLGVTATSGEQRGGLGPTVPRPARRPRGKDTTPGATMPEP